MRFLSCCWPVFASLFSFIYVFFGRARKRPKGQIRHTLRAKTCFFKVHACAGFAARTTTDGQKKTPKENGKKTNNHQKTKNVRVPAPASKKSTKNDLPEAPRDPPGGPRRARRGQEAPRGKSRSEAVLEGPGPPLAATLGPHGAQRRPGGLQALIWCPPGPLGKHCWLHFW